MDSLQLQALSFCAPAGAGQRLPKKASNRSGASTQPIPRGPRAAAAASPTQARKEEAGAAAVQTLPDPGPWGRVFAPLLAGSSHSAGMGLPGSSAGQGAIGGALALLRPPASEQAPATVDPHRSASESLVGPTLRGGPSSDFLAGELNGCLSVSSGVGKEKFPSSARELGIQFEEGAGSAALDGVGEDDYDDLWLQIREEARRDAESEPALASYLFSTVLAHRSLEGVLAAHLANKLASPTLLSLHLLSLFREVLLQSPGVCATVRRDLRATRERDPACTGFLQCLLNFKGFGALQAHRVAHELWRRGRRSLALALQSRCSEVFHVDIHPAARVGSGVMLDHATGIVIGETTEVGNDVSMLHNVTLGGTGVIGGRRHPKVEDGVVLGTGARVLGPVVVGRGARVGAGSLVLEDVPPGATVVGNPARQVMKDRSPGPYVLDYTI